MITYAVQHIINLFSYTAYNPDKLDQKTHKYCEKVPCLFCSTGGGAFNSFLLIYISKTMHKRFTSKPMPHR